MRVIVLGALLSFVAGGCASGIKQLDSRGAEQLTLSKLRETKGQRLAAAMKAGRALVVKLKAGDELPLKLSSRLGPLTLVAGSDNKLRCERDLYLYISNKGTLLGPDGKRWAALGDWKALQKLFGLGKGGSLRIGFGANAKEGPKVDIALHGS